MCDESELYFTKALLAEQLRMRQARKEARDGERKPDTAAKPAAKEPQPVPQERVPA